MRGGMGPALTYMLVGEKLELNKCLKEAGEKREKALEKIKRNSKLGTYITTWSEDDRYADDNFYQKKLLECYDRYTKSKYAIGVSANK